MYKKITTVLTKVSLSIGILTFVMASIFVTSVPVVKANPLVFLAGTQTRTATSSLSDYLTQGNSTTTLAYDSYTNGSGIGINRGSFLLQMVSTSTLNAVARINIEYSQDGVDWYQEAGTNIEGYATTSKTFDLSPFQFNFQFASTTAGLGAPTTTAATTTRIITVRIPTRYVRAVFTATIGSSPFVIWSKFVPMREKNE